MIDPSPLLITRSTRSMASRSARPTTDDDAGEPALDLIEGIVDDVLAAAGQGEDQPVARDESIDLGHGEQAMARLMPDKQPSRPRPCRSAE